MSETAAGARLQRLHPDGRRLVTPELISGQQALWPATAYAELVRPLAPEIDLRPLDVALDALLHEYPTRDPSLDAPASVAVHRALPLSRRQASDPAPWRFLAIVHRPDVVRHRYENRSLRKMKSRYWTLGTRSECNLLSRWWWIAELTRAGDDYTLTRRVLDCPVVARPLFDSELGWHRPLIEASVAVLGGQSRATVDVVVARLRKVLSVVVLESRGRPELEGLLVQLLADTPAG